MQSCEQSHLVSSARYQDTTTYCTSSLSIKLSNYATVMNKYYSILNVMTDLAMLSNIKLCNMLINVTNLTKCGNCFAIMLSGINYILEKQIKDYTGSSNVISSYFSFAFIYLFFTLISFLPFFIHFIMVSYFSYMTESIVCLCFVAVVCYMKIYN